MHKMLLKLLAVASLVLIGSAGTAKAADPMPLPRQFYYPYYPLPSSYWPQQSPKYPEAKGQPMMKPPAYMAYPPFREPGWRYELFEPQRYYRGHHFWLDQF